MVLACKGCLISSGLGYVPEEGREYLPHEGERARWLRARLPSPKAVVVCCLICELRIDEEIGEECEQGLQGLMCMYLLVSLPSTAIASYISPKEHRMCLKPPCATTQNAVTDDRADADLRGVVPP